MDTSNRTAWLWARADKFGKGTQMAETTTTKSDGANFRRFALVLMIVLIAFGVLELAGVIKV